MPEPAALDPPSALRLRLLRSMAAQVDAFDAQEREATRELAHITKESGSTLYEIAGISTRSAAELLVQSGDPRRFAGAGAFARFNGTALLAASSAEGDDEPRRRGQLAGGGPVMHAADAGRRSRRKVLGWHQAEGSRGQLIATDDPRGAICGRGSVACSRQRFHTGESSVPSEA
jgi:hypothetical protein